MSISWLGNEADFPASLWVQRDFDAPEILGRGFVVPECSSTFDALLELPLKGGLQPWDWLLGCRQSKGRGQYGRYWHSPLGNLCVSQVLPDISGMRSSLLPMLLAQVFVDVLRQRGFDVRLKWPNDLILFSGQKLLGKLGGLLVEQKQSHSLLGLGLNLVPISKFVDDSAGLTPIHINVSDLLVLWAECCESLQRTWPRWCAMQGTAMHAELYLAFCGQQVEFVGQERIVGRMLGITEDGELLLETPEAGVLTKRHGSLRPHKID